MNKKWVWKYDLGERENVEALFKEIEDYQGEGETQEEEIEPQPTRKRSRSEGTSQQSTQAFDSEPPWAGQMFYRMSLMESNFNTRMDAIESNFNLCFNQVDENFAHLQHDVHHFYEQQGITCTYSSLVPPPPPSPPPT